MECNRCGNKDPSYFYKGSKGYYCRKCIGFSRILIEEDIQPFDYEIYEDSFEYGFNYELTPKQKIASNRVKGALIRNQDVLLHCVCGAGKTEISIESISYYLSLGLKVAYAIARKEVVVELQKRFSSIFKKANVVGVYGNHHDELKGDLIVCTCHQLYRYHKTFDLLVIDEVDAFPLKGNDTLMQICLRACRGNIIFSTATVNKQLMDVLKNRNVETVELFTRPSNRPLCIPKLLYLTKPITLFYLFFLMRSMTNQCIIFVSSKKECITLKRLFRFFFSCDYVYSDAENRNQVIHKFRNNEIQFLISTTVLERGVTFYNISVIILDFFQYFDEGNLIQMLGRVGRSIKQDDGKAFLISNRYDPQIIATMKYLKQANSYL